MAGSGRRNVRQAGNHYAQSEKGVFKNKMGKMTFRDKRVKIVRRVVTEPKKCTDCPALTLRGRCKPCQADHIDRTMREAKNRRNADARTR